jgi:hypothetical protein
MISHDELKKFYASLSDYNPPMPSLVVTKHIWAKFICKGPFQKLVYFISTQSVVSDDCD